MWWWGPRAGASCCADVVVPKQRRAVALYDELVPLLTDSRAINEADTAALLPASEREEAEIAPGIYRARDVRTHDAVVLKVFPKAVLKNKSARRRLRQELKVLGRCRNHPNILRLYGVYSSARTFEIAFELARGGEVMQRMVSADYSVTNRELSRAIADVASAILFLHDRGFVHGEVRPEHLLYADAEPDARVVLVDFGRAAPWKELTFRSRVQRKSFVWQDRHSAKFLPPAVLQQRPVDGALVDWRHARQVDVWALGVTMFVLLFGAFPFDGETAEEIADRVVHTKLVFPAEDQAEDATVSRAARDLLTKLLEKDPCKAPTIHDVCGHPWLSAEVAASGRWSDARVAQFAAFAESYSSEVASSSLRQRTVDGSARSHAGGAPAYDVYGIGHVETDEEGDEAQRPSFVSTDGNVRTSDGEERLSADAYMRLASAELEALAAAKSDALSPRRAALTADERWTRGAMQRRSRAVARASSNQEEDEGERERGRPPPPLEEPKVAEIQGDFWPVIAKQRRFLSLKSLSFLSSSSSSKGDP